MSLYTASLNSGSNGNCYYIGNDHEAVLVDAGLSCKETERRMKSCGLGMERIKAIFISHEHGDHIKGVEGLAAKFRIPIYITPATLKHSRLRIDSSLLHDFTAHQPVAIGNLSILSFRKAHDAIEPHSFTISGNGVTIGVFTDIGVPCAQLASHFRQCHAAYLEANYDTDMLVNGRYPYHLKKRISGGFGHLSNKEALDMFLANRPAFMTHLYLSHLSKENNTPQAAADIFAPHAGNTNVVVASRDHASDVYHIRTNVRSAIIKRALTNKHAQQMALF